MTVVVERDVPVAMRDGVVLRADVYRSHDGSPAPGILLRTPYDKTSRAAAFRHALDPIHAVGEGFACVFQDVRGRYASDGDFVPFAQELEDGFDTVEWLAAQEWCDGHVGMTGASYCGATQWLAARQRPPSLRAIAPAVTASEYYEGWTYRGGAFELGFALFWTLASLGPEHARRLGGPADEIMEHFVSELDRIDDVYRQLPLGDVADLERLASFYREWLDHPEDDAYWKAMAPNQAYGDIDVPALNIGGWYDIFLAGTLENFVRMRSEAPTERARTGQRLLVGPWTHGVWNGWHPERVFGTMASSDAIDLTGIQLDFFRCHLREGVPDAPESEAPVRIFVMGANVWRDEAQWPLARAEPTPWYLHARGGVAGGLSPIKPASAAHDEFDYDPADPAPTVGGATLLPGADVVSNAGPHDHGSPGARADVLSYESEPLSEPLEVTGPLNATLLVGSSAPRTDFVARLLDVHPDGRALLLAEGIARVKVEASPMEVRIDLAATSNVFLAGHRVRLDVTSASFPRFDRNINRETEGAPQIARQAIFHDPDRPSRVDLPVVAA